MAKSLVIVESPAKAKTIIKFLGKDFAVKASVGHLIDLPKSELGVDIEDSFKPTYVVIKGKGKILKELKAAAKKAENIYIAPDPDREGEAIAWHIANQLGNKKGKKIYRVLFNEITKKTVQDAVKNPCEIDIDKVDAQQTRRILDRLVGYKISPILWKKVRRGLSAGRVQSIALRLIYEREKEVQAFTVEEYWTIKAVMDGGKPPRFEASLFHIAGKKAEIKSKEEAIAILQNIEGESLLVDKVQKKERKRNPVPPFITSTLQQEASSRFRYSARKTMGIAQKLYEGMDIGEEGSVGLITYMRTDSTRIAGEAMDEVRKFISDKYGSAYLPDKPRVYKTKKSAQDAHEAIRSTSVLRDPVSLYKYLSKEEMNIYQLIWKRFVASQMNPSILDITSIDLKVKNYTFRATGSVIKFIGFMTLYTELIDGGQGSGKKDKGSSKGEQSDKILPDLLENEKVDVVEIDKNQHFTQPPPRYSESTLIKELEDKGIGRPSTYAQIMTVIRDRDYVVEEERKFHPTDLGRLITELLIENFPKIMDITFTAEMETKLDDIEEGKRSFVETLEDFYRPFEKSLTHAESHMRNIKTEIEATDIVCEKCNGQMGIRWGKFGKFLACMNYPECKNTKQIKEEGNGELAIEEEEVSDQLCESCESKMIVKRGKFGKFLSCSTYPDCKFTSSVTTGVDCPDCKGYLGTRYSKRGKVFYGCSNYPKCNFALWNKPVPKQCPLCQNPFLIEKHSKKDGVRLICSQKDCGYKGSEENS